MNIIKSENQYLPIDLRNRKIATQPVTEAYEESMSRVFGDRKPWYEKEDRLEKDRLQNTCIVSGKCSITKSYPVGYLHTYCRTDCAIAKAYTETK